MRDSRKTWNGRGRTTNRWRPCLPRFEPQSASDARACFSVAVDYIYSLSRLARSRGGRSMQLFWRNESDGQRNHFDTLFTQLIDFFARGLPANRPFGRFAVVNLPRLVGESLADVFSVLEHVLDHL